MDKEIFLDTMKIKSVHFYLVKAIDEFLILWRNWQTF